MENELFSMVEGYDANSRSIRLISQAAPLVGMDEERILEFIQPQDIRVYRLHVKLFGKIKSIWGCTSLHNRSRGAYKGGIRIAPDVDVFETVELSRLMTIKTACVGLEFGGAKTGIRFDMAKAYQEFGKKPYDPEFEANIKREILHEFSHLFKPALVGHVYIPAPDIGTNAIDMAAIYNETNDPSSVTGKPEGMPGWLPGRNEATGYGVAECTQRLLDGLSLDVKDAQVAIQGFGNVGMHSAMFLAEKGASVVAISDKNASLYDEEGLDIPKLSAYALQTNQQRGANHR